MESPCLSHSTKTTAKPCGEGTQHWWDPISSQIQMPFSAQLPRALCSAGFCPPDAPEPCISSWQDIFTAEHLLPVREQVFTPVGLLNSFFVLFCFFGQNNPVFIEHFRTKGPESAVTKPHHGLQRKCKDIATLISIVPQWT